VSSSAAATTTVDEKSPRVGFVVKLARDVNDEERKRRDRAFRGAFKRQAPSSRRACRPRSQMRVTEILKDLSIFLQTRENR